MSDDEVIPLTGVRPMLSQDERALRGFTIARLACGDCPADVGESCMRRNSITGKWHERRMLHDSRTKAAKQLLGAQTDRQPGEQ